MQLITTIKPLLAGAILLTVTHAHATLTNYTANGQEVVYSSVSDVTWTKDANLLGSMFASQGFDTVVNAIIAASPTITYMPNTFSPSGTYSLSRSDFRSNGNGSVSWFGALAFINYLNSIKYAGTSQWRLPTVATSSRGYNTSFNGTVAGDELVELFYSELGSKGAFDIDGNRTVGKYGISDPDQKFENVRKDNFWTSTEANIPDFDTTWILDADDGEQGYSLKNRQYFVWAVSPGRIGVVPEPESVAMLLAGLGLVVNVLRRRRG